MLTVKITGSSTNKVDGVTITPWYAPMAGTHQTFEVFDFDELHFKTSYAVDPYKENLLIPKAHAEVIR